jgi:hypothetical protein
LFLIPLPQTKDVGCLFFPSKNSPEESVTTVIF